MDIINANDAVATIVSGSSGYLVQFLPIFALAVGLALALAVMAGLLNTFFGRKDLQKDDDVI